MRLFGIVEHEDGAALETSREMLTFARRLAGGEGSLEAVAFGAAARDLAEELGALGVSRLHVVEHALVDDYGPETWAESVAQLVGKEDPDGVLASGTDRGNEVMAHVAARNDLPMAANCTAIDPGDVWALTRQRWAGSLLEEARLTAPTKLVTVSPHAVEAEAAERPGDVDVETFAPTLDPELARTTVVQRTTRGEGITLTTAPVVVSGGRGVGSAEGFAVLEELADLLGGAVGCSRVATNNAWRPHSDQVGQTGARVAPDLYIACGISGATQHWVGCMDSKRILAINLDADAPLVKKADYAVLGDLHEVLPTVVAEIRRRTGR